MECRLRCEKPGDIEFTMTVTMKAKDWEALRDQFDRIPGPRPWPASTLISNIDDLLAQARKLFWPNVAA